MKSPRDYTITAVQRASQILKLFKHNGKELSISEISQLSGLGRSSVLRFVYTLRKEGFLSFDELTKKYSLGIEVYKLGVLKYENMNLRVIANKYLHEVADEEKVICYIGVREGDQLAMIDKILPSDKPSWAQLTVSSGGCMELYSTGIGRLFLAHDTDLEVERYLNKSETFKIKTDKTVISKEELWREIKSARELGYNVNKGENEPNIYGICAPVYDRSGKMVAGVSICGLDQVCELKYNHLCEVIVSVGNRISNELGYE